jgi:hypothetical protein
VAKATVTRLPLGKIQRLERRLATAEARLAGLAAHAGELEELLKRLVRVVAVEHRRIVREHERSEARLTRLIRDVAKGRTADLRRLALLERPPRRV